MIEPSTSELSVAVVHLVGQLAWPAAIIYLVAVFRVPLKDLLDRIATLKLGGNEVIFQRPVPPSDVPRVRAEVALDTGPDGFLTAESIRGAVDGSGLLDETERARKELLIFQSPDQRTWLVATQKHVFVLLDDERTRARRSLIQTFFERDEVFPLDFGLREGAGILKFAAEDTWWLYSLQIFPAASMLKDAMRRLIS